VGTERPKPDERERAGLCADCHHVRRLQSERGSVFFLCKLSFDDPNFPKYPRLPVLVCSGYEKTLAS
jgi:hypothetical protein